MRTSVDSSGGKATAAQPGKSPSQLQYFEQAMRLFHARKFREARELFLLAAGGPERQMAHKAELHVRMCDRRLENRPVVFQTAEEHYDYAITQINVRNLPAAQQHLLSALEQDPTADYVYYALALCLGLNGDAQGAYENMKRAIELQPRNRLAARQDADFAAMAVQPQFDALLYPEKKG